MTPCKYFIPDKRSSTGGICGYSNCCPSMEDDEVKCPNKKHAKEYEIKKNQTPTPSPLRMKNESPYPVYRYRDQRR
ncbi:MAG: hypothetical protein MUO73_09420 [Thermoplasmata archaeon]|nr:hypothetical protein [Thermoplasmata archaeon]